MGTKNNPGKFDCYDNAKYDEPMFILLGRDPTLAQSYVNGYGCESYSRTMRARTIHSIRKRLNAPTHSKLMQSQSVNASLSRFRQAAHMEEHGASF